MSQKYLIIGDVHGCVEQFSEILKYTQDDRIPVSCGDLIDRGPDSRLVLWIVAGMVRRGEALCVRGNHDDKLLRYLSGKNVTQSHGLGETIRQIEAYDRVEDKEDLREFLESLPTRLELDGGKLVIVHGAEAIFGESDKRARSLNLYSYTTGKTTPEGFPERLKWANQFHGGYTIVHGHDVVEEVSCINNVWNVDTGCVFGGKLSALKWPECEVVSVPGHKVEVS